MTNRTECRNCGKAISADLSIYSNMRGFTKVFLGFKCRCCGTTYKPADFLAVAARVQGVRK